MKRFLPAFLFLLSLTGYAQPPEMDARNGWTLAPYGHLHVLVIFAEIRFDSSFGSLDPTPAAGRQFWKAGEMPSWKDELFDPRPGNAENKGFMTRYFNQASFGKFIVTGDYINRIISVPISGIRDRNNNVVTQEPFGSNHYKNAVLGQVNAGKFETGSGFNSHDFDRWTFSSAGLKKTDTANGRMDMVMIIWRNLHVKNMGDNSGFASPGNIGSIMGMESDNYCMFRMSNEIPVTIMRHEFSHLLYGGNNFHNADGGVGTRTFLGMVGGYSNLSTSSHCSEAWNAWDRERMGWKPEQNRFLISARDGKTGEEIPGLLTYGKPVSAIIKLRDFVSYGDAVKIPLPHIPAGTMKQYLWLENHQLLEGNIDHTGKMPKGIYAYIQAGKDVMTGMQTFGGDNNYTWPLVPAGNFDFVFPGDPKKDKTIEMISGNENPFTGHHYLMSVPLDLDGDGRWTNELIFPAKVIRDSDTLPTDYFTFERFPVYGTRELGYNFDTQTEISLSTNPAPVPVLTCSSGGGPRNYDNRKTWLNGISIRILRFDEEGSAYLQIRWNDFEVRKNRRWCGQIVVKDSLIIASGKNILIDQGNSLQLPLAYEKNESGFLFSEPSVLELDSGSVTILDPRSEIRIRTGSSLIVRKGATLILKKRAKLTAEPGSYFQIEEGSRIQLQGNRAKLDLDAATSGIRPKGRQP